MHGAADVQLMSERGQYVSIVDERFAHGQDEDAAERGPRTQLMSEYGL
jgi:hypothetical protein